MKINDVIAKLEKLELQKEKLKEQLIKDISINNFYYAKEKIDELKAITLYIQSINEKELEL